MMWKASNISRQLFESWKFPRSEIAEICQVLAAILHIGQLEFHSGQATTTQAEESGGYSHEGGEEVTVVKNHDILTIVAAFLGLSAQDLEASFGYKTKTIHRERVTVMLDPKGARDNADELARTLYSLLVAYIMEHINQRTMRRRGCRREYNLARRFSWLCAICLDRICPGSALEQCCETSLCTTCVFKASLSAKQTSWKVRRSMLPQRATLTILMQFEAC